VRANSDLSDHFCPSDAEEPDEILDRLECSANKQSIIRQLTASQVYGCLKLAGENAEQARYHAAAEMEKELAVRRLPARCPPSSSGKLTCLPFFSSRLTRPDQTSFPSRDVRGFRVLRIRDAGQGDKPSTRTAQLTVWDAESLGQGFFQEGKRYFVSGVSMRSRRRAELTICPCEGLQRDSEGLVETTKYGGDACDEKGLEVEEGCVICDCNI
jgi:hypothetical protein